MTSLVKKLLVAGCLAAGLSSSAHAQFSFPYTSTPTQARANPIIEDRSAAIEPSTQPAAKHERKSHKNVAGR